MSHAVHLNLIYKNFPGFGASEGWCLPYSGVSGVAVTSNSSRGDCRSYPQIKIGSIRCGSRAASFVLKASDSARWRNLDFSKQTKQGSSRNRNKQNDDRDSLENLDESELLTSRIGPLYSLSGSGKSLTTAALGPIDKEIVELFKKTLLRIAADKEEKKVEASQGKGKNSDKVESLFEVLRRHSSGKVKKKENSANNLGPYHLAEESQPHIRRDGSTSTFKRNKKQRNDIPSITRPPSNFRRKSPIPKVKNQPIHSSRQSTNSTFHLNSGDEKNYEIGIYPDTVQQSESEESKPDEGRESESETKANHSYPDTFDKLLEGKASDTDDIDEDGGKQQLIEHEDLSLLKVQELKILAKSRGLRGFSKMKKGELVELLRGGSV